jgi:uroporphyrinogen decarboxylase
MTRRERVLRALDHRELEMATFKIWRISLSKYERAWSLRGIENLLTDMVLHPSFVHDLLDRICTFDLQIVDLGLSHGVDGFYFGDDWGQQKGLIMGPRLWRIFIKPRITRLWLRSP